MKIAILTLGSRGDVQPYAVLGRALKERGHHVTLATAKNFKELVTSYGINFAPVEADYQAILNSDEGKRIIKANPFAIRRNLETWIYPLAQQSLSEFYHLAKQSDKVIYHVKTMADCFADQFPEKMLRAMVVPVIQPTQAFANPAFSGLPIPWFLNKISYRLTDLAIKMMATPVRKFRQSIGLPAAYQPIQTSVIYGISPTFLAKPADYPHNSFFTGFWFAPSADELDSDIIDFINAGDKPLLITFGSMPFESKMDIAKTLIDISTQLNARIIAIKGWGLTHLEAFDNHPSIKVISAAPYDKLFPLVKAAVHHGGAGTTAECIKAGIPFLVCPILYPIGDQYFWGKLAYDKGIALKPVPVKNLTTELFIRNVHELLTTENLYTTSKQLSEKVNHENGIANAIKIIEQSKHA